jgi:Sporulation related domain.
MTWSDDDLIDGRNRSGMREDRATGGTRRIPIVAVVAGSVFAAALVGSGVTWLLLGSGGQRADSSPPPLIKADDKPIKVHPDSPGGMTVENSDKLVYSRLRGETMKGEVERILPEPQRPEKPAPDEVATISPPAAPSKEPGAVSVAEPDDRPAEAAPAIPSLPTQLGEDPEEMEAPIQVPARVVAPPPAPPAPKAVESKPVPKPVESKPAQVASARPVPAPPPTKPAEKPATASAPASGRYQVQLLAARSPEGASAAWKKIQAKNGDVLGGLSSTVARADLGDKGVFYRLRVGPIADEAKAKSLCSTLKSRSVSCLIIGPGA